MIKLFEKELQQKTECFGFTRFYVVREECAHSC